MTVPSLRGARPGRPKTGGRKAGTPNKIKGQQALMREAKAIANKGETPLAFLLRVMRDEENVLDVRLNAAKAAAPYCHPALKAIEVSGSGGGAVEFRVTLAFD